MQILISIINAVLVCALAVKLVHVLQLEGYRFRALVSWIFDIRQTYLVRLFTLSLLGFGSAFAIYIFSPGLWAACGLIVYLTFGILLLYLILRTKSKVPLKFTARVIRLFIVIAILSGGLSYLLAQAGFQYVPLLATLLAGVVFLSHAICFPIEWLIKRIYIAKAKRKLFSPEYSKLIRIGITGSYGKTSCKNILSAMLAIKYNVAISPASYNTPMGFCKTINESLSLEHEILIMEMGMRYRGDIKMMSRLFRPHHGILTSVGKAHLETMKSIDNIRKEKLELINALPEEGFRVVGDDVLIKDHVKDIIVSDIGCTFTYKDIIFKTKLLGEHNIKNIVICAMMAENLGVTIKKIASAVTELEPPMHRLELIKSVNGVFILDDSYNASPDGTVAALETLKLFKGKKVVMTPGMVELGKRASEENFKFGYRMASVADNVIIVNELNKQMIQDGLLAGGMAAENIICVKTLDDAKLAYGSILKSGDVLLISNDLPDNYA